MIISHIIDINKWIITTTPTTDYEDGKTILMMIETKKIV